MSIGISGLGRIGRLAFRIAHSRGLLHAVDDRNDVAQIVPLLRRDTIYGLFPGDIMGRGDGIEIDGRLIRMLRSMSFPSWNGAEIVLECAGDGPDGKKARRHIMMGAKRVIISAPAPNVDATLVLGVNEASFNPERHLVISMASCTTNCVAPILKVLEPFGLRRAHLDSVNAYTNAQRLVDAPHGDPRRARAAGLNIIPTESSTGDSLEALFPGLPFRGQAFRVPVACGSVCSLWVETEKTLTAAGINQWMMEAASDILAFSLEPLVSSDFIGDSHSAIIDGLLTEVNGSWAHIVAWYDNEWAYATRLCDLAQFLEGKG